MNFSIFILKYRKKNYYLNKLTPTKKLHYQTFTTNILMNKLIKKIVRIKKTELFIRKTLTNKCIRNLKTTK